MPATVVKDEALPIGSSNDVVQVRQTVRALALSIGLSLIDQTKIVTAASELARNTLEHGGGGTARLQIIDSDGKLGVKLVFSDTGPGITDLKLALTDGYTTGKGMGLGLSGSRRLVSEFDLDSKPGEGTRVTVIKWK